MTESVGTRTSMLLKSSIELAESRIAQVLALIRNLKQGDFPHESSRQALLQLEKRFIEELEAADGKRSADSLEQIRYCIHLSQKIDFVLHGLGLILRSTNVRNAFESFHPLERLVKLLVDDSSHLIFSTEWDYIPFTYPLTVPYLRNFVMIGLPVTEAENSFLLPLSAHEIGHSIWLHRDLGREIASEIENAATRIALSREEEFRRLLTGSYRNSREIDLEFFERISRSIDWSESQLEEIFCDLVGVLVFGESFGLAFHEYMAPGDLSCTSLDYPATSRRAQIIEEYSTNLGIPIAAGYAASFERERFGDKALIFEERLSAAVTDELTRLVFDKAVEIVDNSGVGRPDGGNIDEIERRIRQGLPPEIKCSAAEIICAGWRCRMELQRKEPSDVDVTEINEIVFKGFELNEWAGK